MRRLGPMIYVTLALAGCGYPMPLSRLAATTPIFDPIAYWTGHVTSWGVVENRAGEPTDTVQTICDGTPDGAGGVSMHQTVTLGDGTVQHRDWHLRRTSPGHFVGTANDMVGEAAGEASGRIFHWRFVLATRPGEAWRNVVFEQWMYALDDHRMLNRTSIRKLGVVLAQVSEVFTRP